MFQLLSRLHFLQNCLGRLVSWCPPVFVHNLGKYWAIKKALYLTGLEGLEGGYFEFGVFTGSSFACAIQCAKRSGVKDAHRLMKFYGFDSFEGFGELDEKDAHPFYVDLNFKTDFEVVKKRLKKVAGKRKKDVNLIQGFFNETCVDATKKEYGLTKASVILIDNDTYSAAMDCFAFCTSLLQHGTIIILDDAFSYRGATDKGVHGAMQAWLAANPLVRVRLLSHYGMGGEVYIVADCP